jgi:hypothetical protein
VIATMIAQYNRIWTQPMAVMVVVPSEQFGPEQRVDEVDEKAGGHEAGERIVEDHDRSPQSRSQA